MTGATTPVPSARNKCRPECRPPAHYSDLIVQTNMELAKLILEFIKALAWPVTALVLALLFRAPLSMILKRLRKAGLPGGVSIDFEEEIEEAKQVSREVEALPAPTNRPNRPSIPLTEANARMIELGLKPTISGLDISYYREIAQGDPTLALAGLRIEIEVLANNLALGFKLETRRTEPIGTLLRRLREGGAITAEQMDLARRILAICNRAIHGQNVTHDEAIDVIDAASVLVNDFLAWLSWDSMITGSRGRSRKRGSVFNRIRRRRGQVLSPGNFSRPAGVYVASRVRNLGLESE